MEFDTRVKLAVYHHFAKTGRRPGVAGIAEAIRTDPDSVGSSLTRLARDRLLVLEQDGESIRMAPPFSGVETQHRVRVGDQEYFANCAWDAFGVVAALGTAGTVLSRCEQSHDPLELAIAQDGPEFAESGTWLFHTASPASKWWDDIVYT